MTKKIIILLLYLFIFINLVIAQKRTIQSMTVLKDGLYQEKEAYAFSISLIEGAAIINTKDTTIFLEKYEMYSVENKQPKPLPFSIMTKGKAFLYTSFIVNTVTPCEELAPPDCLSCEARIYSDTVLIFEQNQSALIEVEPCSKNVKVAIDNNDFDDLPEFNGAVGYGSRSCHDKYPHRLTIDLTNGMAIVKQLTAN